MIMPSKEAPSGESEANMRKHNFQRAWSNGSGRDLVSTDKKVSFGMLQIKRDGGFT